MTTAAITEANFVGEAAVICTNPRMKLVNLKSCKVVEDVVKCVCPNKADGALNA